MQGGISLKQLKRMIGTGLAGAALALFLMTPAGAVTEILRLDGRDLWQEARTQMVESTTYVSLRTMTGYLRPDATVSWRGGTAWVEGDGLILSARPGEMYMAVNDRRIYLPHGVRAENGSVLVPVRALTEALGGTVAWSREEGVTVTAGNGEPVPAPYEEEELYWMARIIHAESGGEPMAGKLAVGTVVLNRVASPEFPNTVYDVIFDRKWGVQFTPAYNGMIYREPGEESVLAAKLVLEGARVAGDSLYFLAPSLTQNHWIMENREYVTTIGGHYFYC